MEFVLVDTDVLINAFENKTDDVYLLESIGRENVLLSSITYMEICRGARNKSELNEILKKLKGYNILDFTPEISRLAIKLIEEFHLSQNLQIPDAIIGASSLHFHLELLTNNKKDYRFIPRIRFYKE